MRDVAQGVGPDSAAPSSPAARHYKRRELVAADGGRLVLRTDGTIDLLAADRSLVRSLGPEDAEWGVYAFRFGIRVQERTIAPRGQNASSSKPRL